MPIYEYSCRVCGERFELRRTMSDSDTDIECPKCGAKHPQRLISAFATGPSTGSSTGYCAPTAST